MDDDKSGDDMTIYRRPKKKWYQKVKWLKNILIAIAIFIVLFLILYFWIGSSTELIRAIITSFAISILLSINNVYSNVLNYEEFIIINKDKKIILLSNQREPDFYDTDVKYKRIEKFDNDKIDNLIDNIDRNIGIKVLNVDKYDIIKEKNKYIVAEITGKENKWFYEEVKKKPSYKLKENKVTKKYIIDNSFNDYKELVKLFK